MITEFFVTVAMGFVNWLLTLTPSSGDVSPATGLLVTAGNHLTALVSGAAQIGAWMPWDVLGIVLPIVLSFYVAMFVLKIVRQLIAHVPAFGGSG